MGNFEVMHFWVLANYLAIIIISILTIFSWKNTGERFFALKSARKDFYECGFRPSNQYPIQISSQFFLICIFFIVYDIELVFSFPFVSFLTNLSFLDIMGFLLIYYFFVLSLFFDFSNNLLNWKFS